MSEALALRPIDFDRRQGLSCYDHTMIEPENVTIRTLQGIRADLKAGFASFRDELATVQAEITKMKGTLAYFDSKRMSSVSLRRGDELLEEQMTRLSERVDALEARRG